jgi:hypothetical protein
MEKKKKFNEMVFYFPLLPFFNSYIRKPITTSTLDTNNPPPKLLLALMKRK